MRISTELQGARLNVSQAAELLAMDPGHLRRMVRRGIFPAPKRTSKNMPFYDYQLLCQMGQVLRSGVGLSGEEISFYRRRPKQHRRRTRAARRNLASPVDNYIASIIEGCRQLGISDEKLEPSRITAILTAEFGSNRPALDQAVPVVARKAMVTE